jgi:hypothetical protein
MKWFRKATKALIWIWLAGAICFSVFFVLEYKNSLAIEGPEPKFQRIEESTDIVQLKRTSRMYVDFLYGVHGASVRLWKIGLIYGLANVVIAGCCVACFGRSSRSDNVENA